MQDRSEREDALVLSTGARWVAFDVEVDGADAADGEVLAADADGRVEGGVGGEPFAVFGYAVGREEKWLVACGGIGLGPENCDRGELVTYLTLDMVDHTQSGQSIGMEGCVRAPRFVGPSSFWARRFLSFFCFCFRGFFGFCFCTLKRPIGSPGRWNEAGSPAGFDMSWPMACAGRSGTVIDTGWDVSSCKRRCSTQIRNDIVKIEERIGSVEAR